MANDMNEITSRIGHWLKSQNLPTDGVRIILELPTEEAMYRTEAAIKREIVPYLAYHITGKTFGAIETMNGIGFTLRFAKQK
jgi:hypothetical protein